MSIQKLTIPEAFRESVQKYRSLGAVGYSDLEPMTYGDLDELSRILGAGLRSKGIQPGDKVAILSENMPNWCTAYLAISRIGAVVVPVLPDFGPVEVENILEHAGAKALFVSERQMEKTAGMGEKRHVITLDSLLCNDEPIVMIGGNDDTDPQEDDLAAIIYTSGTTGNSKGVMLTHANIISNVIGACPLASIEAGEVLVSLLPLSHAYECTLGFLVPMVSGACVYYLPKPPSPSVLMPALEKLRPHLMLSVPLFIEKIFRNSVLPKLRKNFLMRLLYAFRPIQKILHKAAGRKVYALFGGRLHFFGIGGASLAPDVERFLRDAGFPYAIGYGLTETAPLIAGSAPFETTFRAIGPVLEGVQMRLDGAYGDKNEGEVQVKGPNVMQGYYKDAQRTDEVFTEDGWFRTGDIGHISAKGVLSIRGRIKNMILGSSGENIYPEEIEAVINENPYVEESLVTQKDDRLVAMVFLNYEALLEHLAHSYASIKEWHREVYAGVKEGMQNSSDIVQQGVKQFKEDVEGYATELRSRINSELNVFSRIADVVLRYEPFEKTPTLKIKRYLYT
jgi:long-chain acyl-CoA synthetase